MPSLNGSPAEDELGEGEENDIGELVDEIVAVAAHDDKREAQCLNAKRVDEPVKATKNDNGSHELDVLFPDGFPRVRVENESAAEGEVDVDLDDEDDGVGERLVQSAAIHEKKVQRERDEKSRKADGEEKEKLAEKNGDAHGSGGAREKGDGGK